MSFLNKKHLVNMDALTDPIAAYNALIDAKLLKEEYAPYMLYQFCVELSQKIDEMQRRGALNDADKVLLNQHKALYLETVKFMGTIIQKWFAGKLRVAEKKKSNKTKQNETEEGSVA